MYAEAKMFAAFGEGNICVGCNKVKSKDIYFVAIKELKETHQIAEPVNNEDVVYNQEIILTFPTQTQMLSVMAAFTNKTYEQMLEKWNLALAKSEAREWIETS